jgi:hypothetical protein
MRAKETGSRVPCRSQATASPVGEKSKGVSISMRRRELEMEGNRIYRINRLEDELSVRALRCPAREETSGRAVRRFPLSDRSSDVSFKGEGVDEKSQVMVRSCTEEGQHQS